MSLENLEQSNIMSPRTASTNASEISVDNIEIQFSKQLSLNCEQILKFNNVEYLQTALTHPSFAEEQRENKLNKQQKQNLKKNYKPPQDYQRLEYLGDSVIDFAVANFLFDEYPSYNEKQLTQMRAQMVNQKSLAYIAKKLKLNELLQIGVGGKLLNHQNLESTLCDVFEAYIGAVSKDKGIQFTETYVLQLFKEYYDFDQLQEIECYQKFNPIGYLTEYFSKKHKKIIQFESEILKDEHQENSLFIFKLKFEGKLLGTGSGKSKKIAKQQAYQQACDKLQIN